MKHYASHAKPHPCAVCGSTINHPGKYCKRCANLLACAYRPGNTIDQRIEIVKRKLAEDAESKHKAALKESQKYKPPYICTNPCEWFEHCGAGIGYCSRIVCPYGRVRRAK